MRAGVKLADKVDQYSLHFSRPKCVTFQIIRPSLLKERLSNLALYSSCDLMGNTASMKNSKERERRIQSLFKGKNLNSFPKQSSYRGLVHTYPISINLNTLPWERYSIFRFFLFDSLFIVIQRVVMCYWVNISVSKFPISVLPGTSKRMIVT